MKTLKLHFENEKLIAGSKDLALVISFTEKRWHFKLRKNGKVFYRGSDKNLLPVLNKVIDTGLRFEGFNTVYNNGTIIAMINCHKPVGESC